MFQKLSNLNERQLIHLFWMVMLCVCVFTVEFAELWCFCEQLSVSSLDSPWWSYTDMAIFALVSKQAENNRRWKLNITYAKYEIFILYKNEWIWFAFQHLIGSFSIAIFYFTKMKEEKNPHSRYCLFHHTHFLTRLSE